MLKKCFLKASFDMNLQRVERLINQSIATFNLNLSGLTVLTEAATGFYMLIRKFFAATRNEAVQSLFVLFFVAFAVLTATGVWFRGAGMALVWPWQT